MNRILVWTLLAFVCHAASADRVVPSNRVETHLNVREQPNSTSKIVGAMQPGDSARFERSVPHWYEISLDNGTRGFVSKAWSLVVTDPAPLVTGSIRLGGWNIKKLGHGNSTNFDLVVQVIELNFDIVVVVEVMQRSAGHPGYDTLLQRLGAGWAGMVTSRPRPNTSSGNSEFYAILYRWQRVLPCQGWTELQYVADNDGSAGGSGADVFAREPAFGCFAARLANGSTGFDFMLAAYHARWDSGNITAIKNEVRNMTKVFEAMRQARQGEGDHIIVGDFNLRRTHLEEVVGPVLTVGNGSTLNFSGGLSTNLYDNVLIFDQAASVELEGNPEILDVRDIATSPAVFYQTVSDHLPIRARFRSGSDDD